MGSLPIRKWNHLYCAVAQCGYPITPYPPEGDCATCTACGEAYTLGGVEAPAEPVIKQVGAAEEYSFATDDPSVKIGVDWLAKVARGNAAEESKTIMDTILEFCHTCKKRTQCTYYSKQTRGADEGQTQFYTCTKCEDTWMAHS